MILKKLDINTNAVLQAAKTKWNFLDFQPGLVGGHCIGVDPYYLAYKAKILGVNPNLVLSGRLINNEMSKYCALRLKDGLIKKGIKLKMQKLLFLVLLSKKIVKMFAILV